MDDEARAAAYRLQHGRREAFQAWQDAMLLPASDAPAEQVRANWQPIELFIQEGPDVGEAHEAESEEGQRIN